MTKEKRTVLIETLNFVKGAMKDDSTGHDWLHVSRVLNNAKKIGSFEKADMYVVQLAAMLHDISDRKLNGGDEEAGPRRAAEWLTGMGVDRQVIEQVTDIMRGISFNGAGSAEAELSIEGQIVQDADRLDAIGAVGIARAFAYGASAGRVMYDADVKPRMHASAEEYKNSASPTINHFYEKLLLLKDRMHTKTGKILAEPRHKFLEDFLKQFYREIE